MYQGTVFVCKEVYGMKNVCYIKLVSAGVVFTIMSGAYKAMRRNTYALNFFAIKTGIFFIQVLYN